MVLYNICVILGWQLLKCTFICKCKILSEICVCLYTFYMIGPKIAHLSTLKHRSKSPKWLQYVSDIFWYISVKTWVNSNNKSSICIAVASALTSERKMTFECSKLSTVDYGKQHYLIIE